MKYHFKIHKEDVGFSARCIELRGCFTQGDTLKELQNNMQEAWNLYIDEPEDSKDLARLPDENIKPATDILEVPVEPRIALPFLLKHLRNELGLTQKKKRLVKWVLKRFGVIKKA